VKRNYRKVVIMRVQKKKENWKKRNFVLSLRIHRESEGR